MPSSDREIDQAYNLARHTGAPRLERSEAESLLFGHYADPGRSRELSGALPGDMEGAQSLIQSLEKAVMPHNRIITPAGSGRQSLYTNPNQAWYNIAGVRPRAGELPPVLLRSLGKNNPAFRAALQILKARLWRHARPMRMSPRALLTGMEGYDVVPIGKPDYEELTPAEENRRAQLLGFFANSGDTQRFTRGDEVNREDLERDSLRQVMNLYVEQRYVLDQFTVERELTRNGRRLSGYYVLPSDTIQRVDPLEWAKLQSEEARANPNARFVQVIDDKIETSYGSNDLLFDYVNGSDELGARGYGMSEVEMSYKVAIGVLNVLTSNNAIFDRNAIPPIILQLRGQVSNAQLAEMAEEWNAFRLGAGGEWGMPFFNIKDTKGGLEAVPLKSQPNDMVMKEYVSLMIALTASMIGLDASELNASAFGGSNSNLGGGSNTAARLEDSRNRAFLPMLDRFEENLNLIAHEELDGWELRFQGKNKMDTDVMVKVFRGNMTVDEVRTSLLGLPPIGGLQGGALSDNSAVSQMSLAALKDGMATMDDDGHIMISEGAADARGEDRVPEPGAKEASKGPRGKTARGLQRDD